MGVTCKGYFQHYYDRLKYYSSKEERAAKALLKALARAERVSRDNLYQLYLKETQQALDLDGFNNLMADLENDFYVRCHQTDGTYAFFSRVLKDWWLRFYSL